MEIESARDLCSMCKKETEEFYGLNVDKNKVRLVKIQLYSFRMMPFLVYILLSVAPLILWSELLTFEEYSNEMIMKFIIALIMSYIFWIRINFPLLLQRYVEKNYSEFP